MVLSNPNPNELTISVADSGFGIDKKELKQIFKQFYRGQHKGIKGYGIGLSYLRAIAVAHGGGVTVESTKGVGSRFEVKLNCENDGEK
ncbi:MAG: HAMP domain-containing sensor histidine kinase [Rikenellaceae bacterium]